jgi:hypothetical protein
VSSTWAVTASTGGHDAFHGWLLEAVGECILFSKYEFGLGLRRAKNVADDGPSRHRIRSSFLLLSCETIPYLGYQYPKWKRRCDPSRETYLLTTC